MDHLIEIAVTIIISVLGSSGLWAYIQSVSKSKSASERMLLGLGHAEIFRQSEKYIHREGITTSELEDLIKYLYKPYADMGGNGTAETVVERCRQLPIITEQEADRRDSLIRGGDVVE